jgi:PadR family transcriptional regulator PadR
MSALVLGEFEALLLLAILHLTERGEEPYGSALRAEIEERTSRPVPRGSIYITLDRLEEKGLLASRTTEGSSDRGGRPKRLFRVTGTGLRAVRASVAAMVQMHRGLESVLGRP